VAGSQPSSAYTAKDPGPEGPEWTQRLIEAAISAVITIDASGRVVLFNRAAELMYGYSRDEAVGGQLGDLIVPPSLQDAHWNALAKLETGDYEGLLDHRNVDLAVRKGGEEFPVEWTLIKSGDGPALFTYIVRDLSRIKEAEERNVRMTSLLASAERLAQMGSWQVDVRTGDSLWSDEMYRIHGLEPGTVEPGVEVAVERTHPEDRQRLQALLRNVVDDPERLLGDEVTIDYRVVHPDGSVRELHARGRMESDEQGEPTRWVGLAQDVTDQRLTERELQAHYALSQALRDWETFDEGVIGLLRRLGTALDFCVGALWIWDPKQERLWCRAFWSAPNMDAGEFELATRGRTYQPGEGVPGRTWQSKRPIFREDVSTDPSFLRRDAAEAVGLRSGIAFPALGDDGPLAVLSFYAMDARCKSARLARTLTGIGRELGRFLSQRRAELGAGTLSERELEVLRLASDGNSGPEIAERLVLSPATIKTHFENIYEKLGVSDRAAAVAYAIRIGLIR
jgi:PAS domain S-box-containing protein